MARNPDFHSENGSSILLAPTKPLSTGHYAEIIPLSFGRFRIIVTDGYSVFNNW